MKRGQAVHEAYAKHARRAHGGGLARCPGNGRVVFDGEPAACRAVTALRDLGSLVGHYRCGHDDHWHITNVGGTTAKQRARWRRAYGPAWVLRRPRRELSADT